MKLEKEVNQHLKKTSVPKRKCFWKTTPVPKRKKVQNEENTTFEKTTSVLKRHVGLKKLLYLKVL